MDNAKELAIEITKVLSCQPEEKAKAIIDSPYCEEILQGIPVQDAYMIIKDNFSGDSQFLLPYVKPERIATFIDIDCWKGDIPSIEGIFEWLTELVNAADDVLMDALNVIDLELLILLFYPYMKVTVMSPTDDDIPELLEAGFETFDNNYFFAFADDTEETRLLRFILERSFLYNQDMYFRILEGVRWELPSSMEETAFHHRSIRLTELGFPPSEEASEIYSRKPTTGIMSSKIRSDQIPVIGEKEKYFLPAVYNERISGNDILVSAISETDPGTVEGFAFEMMYLANKVMMADYRPLNDTDSLKASVDKAVALTSLGLSVAMRRKGKDAAAIMKSMTAEMLFSLGFNVLVEQQDRLRRCLKGVGQGFIPMSCRDIAESLLRKYPVTISDRFITIDDVDNANESIDRLELMREIISGIDLKRVSLDGANIDIEGMDLENVVLTMAALNAISGENSLRPLKREEFIAFVDTVTVVKEKKRTVKKKFADGLQGFLSALAPRSGLHSIAGTADQLCRRLETELAGFKSVEEINPRYITCLIIRL